MLFDPLRARRVTLFVTFLAALAALAYVVANDAMFDALGDGAHALFFVSLVVFVTGLIVAAMFGRFARIRAALLASDALARWTTSREEWAAFAKADAPVTRADQRVTLGLILFFAVAIPGVMVAMGGDPKILAVIGLGIVGLGFVGYAIGRRYAASAARFRDGAVAVSRDGLIVNGAFHGWRLFGSRLVDAEIDGEARPAVLSVTYSYWSRGGPQYVTARAPIPHAALAAAHAAVAELRRAAHAGPLRDDPAKA